MLHAIHYLTDTWPWFDEHQCYGRLVHYVKQIQPQTKEVRVRYGLADKMAGRLYSIACGHPKRRDSVFAAAELRFSRSFLERMKADDIYHILFFDNHYQLFERWDRAPRNVIGTVHLPVNREHPVLTDKYLKRLSSCIVMFNEGVKYLEKHVGRGRVKFIHYGVDTEFFKPSSNLAPNTKHLLFTGHNGRNFAMFAKVAKILNERHKDLQFDILVPDWARKMHLYALEGIKNIRWHERLQEAELLKLYQESRLLLMPMEDSGVNTAVVEALACGLPIVTTDVGGIRDYGGGSVYPVVANNDNDAMIALVEEYLNNENRRNEVGEKCRAFAEQNLSWPLVAQKHIEAYKELSV
jgi:glycosyltransferase involved in cell wall biosynthesis